MTKFNRKIVLSQTLSYVFSEIFETSNFLWYIIRYCQFVLTTYSRGILKEATHVNQRNRKADYTYYFNPNKAGLFEGSFFWVGVNLTSPLTPPHPPPSYFKKDLCNIDNFIQLLNNLSKVCWNWKNADIICYKLTSLVSL